MTLKPGSGALKVIGTDTYQSATYDFLLTFHSNIYVYLVPIPRYRVISVENCHFHTPRVFNALGEGVPLGIWYRRKGCKTLE